MVIEYEVKPFHLETCTDMALYMLHIGKDLCGKRKFEMLSHRIV